MLLIFGSIRAQDPTASYYFVGSCEKNPISFVNTSTTPIGTIVRYQWIFGTGVAADTSALENPTFAYQTDGDFLVELTVWNSLNSQSTISQIVTIKPIPESSIDLNVPCFPGTISLSDVSTISSGTILMRNWKFDTLTSSPQTTWSYTPAAKGTYKVTLYTESDFGCVDSINQTIAYTDTPNISLNLSSPVTICDGDSITVVASGGINYLWNDGNTDRTRSLNTIGEYIVTGYTGNSCSSSDTIEIYIAPTPTADAGMDTTIDKGFSAPLIATGGSAYLWSPAGSLTDAEIANPIATPTEDTRYLVKVTNSFGCSAFDSVNVYVNQIIKIPVHNLITPNNDGHNDSWDLSAVPDLANANVHVFNRWGWEVFSSDNYQNNWQGTFNDEPLPDGTYVYVIEFNNGILDPLRGTLEIIRNTQK
ncbi:MAG: hypothetical protein RLZZ337_925 [Bacteroidota bacterium]